MISVCIATYNGSKFIREQLESILVQLSTEDEVIVSDDESTDDTIAIIESFHDPRITILHHNKKKEAFILDYSTHNFENALSHAHGEYIFLSDQDDRWEAGKVEKLKAALKTPNSLAICDCTICDQNLKVIKPSMFAECKSETYIDAFVRFRMLGCCMAFRRELLDKALPFPKTKVGHDLWLFLMAKHYGKIEYVNECLHSYRRHGSTVTPSGASSKYSICFRIYYRTFILRAFLSRIIKLAFK